MQFSGAALRGILANQRDALDVRDSNGDPIMLRVPVARALKDVDLERFVGIGNRTRVRYLRTVATTWTLNSGSRSTRTVRADGSCRTYGAGQLMANSRTLREHNAGLE